MLSQNSQQKKARRTVTAALVAAAAFTLIVPTGTAAAIDHIPCAPRNDLLKIWSHLNGKDSVDCYANRGKASFGGWWIDKISTGNNDVVLYDNNGDVVKIERWRVVTFPNRPPKINTIEIL